jgi:two-component system sensor histidine kinase EvgS
MHSLNRRGEAESVGGTPARPMRWTLRGVLAGLCALLPLAAPLSAHAALAASAAQAASAPAASPPTPATRAAPDYRFRQSTGAALAISAQTLTAEERVFLAALPEVRVAVPLPPSRPYETIAADGEIGGIHPETLVALARTFGLKLRPVVMPDWSSTLQAVRERRVDVVMTLGVTAARMEFLAFTLGATPLPGALFARRGENIDPARARFALERNYMANDWVRRQYPDATIVTVDGTPQALQAVGRGEADLYMGSLLEASDWLAREPVPGVELLRLVNFGTGYYHFGVRKDWAPLAAILNKGIQTLRSRGSDELAAALGGLPAGASVARPLTLPPADAALLSAMPVWRVGAVRGLSLLNEVDERGLHSGIAAEYTEQVARRLGVAVQMLPFDSVAQMLDGMRRGEIDLVPFLTRTPQRSQEFEFSAPYVEMPYMLVARSDGPQYWSLDSLRGKSLALAQQHPLREMLARSYPDIRIVEAPSGQGAMDLVIRREADAAVEVKLFANVRINALDGERLRIVSEVYELPAQFHFATRKGGPALLPLVDRALADIDPRERQRMLRRWVAVDLTPAFPWRRYAPVMAVSLLSLLLLGGGTAWWMRRLKAEVRQRRRSEQLLTDIASTVPGLAFRYVLEADGRLRHHFFTPGAKALLGVELDPRATVLAALAPRMRPEERASAEARQAACLASGEPFDMSCAYAHPDGRERWLQAQAVQTRSASGLRVWTGYVVDVSTQHQLQNRLAQEAEARNLMLASASHELRAPTHTLSLALQSLGTQGLDGEQRHAVQVAQDSARTLAELLNDVLDAARAGHEPLLLRPRSFDLHQLLEDLGRAWRVAARTKGLAFELSIAPEVPRTVQQDPLRLKQVLINLLSNACKYTPQGSVRLSASVGPEGVLQLTVADTGIGIAQSEQARLFEPFVTLDDPRASLPVPAATPAAAAAGFELAGSTGLGLSTSRRVAALMGGQITLHSEPGHGTQVTLSLPLPPAPAGASAAPSGTIVVCDDDDTSRLLLGLMLRRQGFDICETGDSEAALARWRQGDVRALVSDLDLPGMSGLELIRAVRAAEHDAASKPSTAGAARPARTSIIVCSGSPVPAADDAPATGLYDAYLVKPVEMATLTDTLRRLGVTQ